MKDINNITAQYSKLLGDNALILGQRLGEWCGHGPVLEQDIAMTNIALDMIGQARLFYQYACTLNPAFGDEDDLAFLREAKDYHNLLLLELPNQDFAFTIARQFFFSAFYKPFLEKLSGSQDEQLSAIAAKSLKEVTYHLRWSAEWVIRLGDGTELSHGKMQKAVDDLWAYTGEMFLMSEWEWQAMESGIGVEVRSLQPTWESTVEPVFKEATLNKPAAVWMHAGGKQGRHTEHLGYILAVMQYMQRAYPGMEW